MVTESHCGWRNNLCVVAAGAAAVLCHGGCMATVIPATLGVGAIGCVALYGTIQIASSVACFDNFCN